MLKNVLTLEEVPQVSAHQCTTFAELPILLRVDPLRVRGTSGGADCAATGVHTVSMSTVPPTFASRMWRPDGHA